MFPRIIRTPTLGLILEEKKCVLYAENYGKIFKFKKRGKLFFFLSFVICFVTRLKHYTGQYKNNILSLVILLGFCGLVHTCFQPRLAKQTGVCTTALPLFIYLFIYLFVYLVRKLFLNSLLLRRLWMDLNADFFYKNLQGFNSSGCAYVSNGAYISTYKK